MLFGQRTRRTKEKGQFPGNESIYLWTEEGVEQLLSHSIKMSLNCLLFCGDERREEADRIAINLLISCYKQSDLFELDLELVD